MAAPTLPTNNDFANLMKKLGHMDASGGFMTILGQSGLFGGVPGLVDAQALAAGVGNGADATADTLFTKALAANLLDKNTDALLVVAMGTLAANGNNKTVKLTLGGTDMFSSGVITTNGKNFALIALIIRTAAAVQIAVGALFCDATSPVVKVVTNGAEDLTTALTLKLTGTSGSSAASDIIAYSMETLLLNAGA